MSGRIQHGVNVDLETQADEILKQSFIEKPDPEGKKMILTRWMDISRKRREVYCSDGVPDGAVRRGNFHRVINPTSPHLNAVDGVVSRPRRRPALGDVRDSE